MRINGKVYNSFIYSHNVSSVFMSTVCSDWYIILYTSTELNTEMAATKTAYAVAIQQLQSLVKAKNTYALCMHACKS